MEHFSSVSWHNYLPAGLLPDISTLVELNDQIACFSDDLDNDIDDIIQEFEGKCEREVLHTVLFY